MQKYLDQKHNQNLVKTSPSMEVRQLHNLKALNGLNSKFTAEIIHHPPHSSHQKYNLYEHSRNTSKSLEVKALESLRYK